MRLFYNFQKSQPLADSLTWSHYQELIPLNDANKINYYIKIVEEQNLSKRQLRERIKNKEQKHPCFYSIYPLLLKRSIVVSLDTSPVILFNVDSSSPSVMNATVGVPDIFTYVLNSANSLLSSLLLSIW